MIGLIKLFLYSFDIFIPIESPFEKHPPCKMYRVCLESSPVNILDDCKKKFKGDFVKLKRAMALNST